MTSETLKTILICVYVAVILSALLAGLIGFLKGIYKTTLKTILKAVLITILVFVSPLLSNAIGNINIQGIIHSESAITLQTYLANLITSTGLFSPVNGIAIYQTAFAIVNSFLSFVVFFLGMVFIQIFASPLTALFYNGIFRFFLPVETKKERKLRKSKDRKDNLQVGLLDDQGKVETRKKRILPLLRIPGAALGAIQEFIFVLLLLCPFSALCTTMISRKDSIHNILSSTSTEEKNVQSFDSYLAIVNDSWIYKTTSFMGFDSILMNKTSNVSINGMNVSFNGLVNSLFDVCDPLISNGTISYDNVSKSVTINFSILLSVESVDSIITTMISNPMVMALIPPLIDVGLNSLSGQYFAIDKLDFNNIDWSDELTILNSIYSEVYSCIQPMIEKDKFNLNNFYLNTSSFSDEQIATYVKALSSLGELETFKKNIANILSGAGVYLNHLGYDILPRETESYEGIDWSKELSIYGNIALRFLRLIQVDISSKMNPIEIKDKLLSALKEEDKRKELEALVLSSDDTVGLIDSDLFSILSVPDILSSTLSSIPSLRSYIEAINLKEVLKDKTKEDYKSELKVMFQICDNLFAENSKIDFDDLASTDLEDEETTDQLADLLKVSKNSSVFKLIYPSLMKSILFENSFDFSNYLFGLTPYNFNYDADDFIDDFASLLSLMPKIRKLGKDLSDDKLTTEEKILSLDTSFIHELLSIVIESRFFNSDLRLGISSTNQKNVNIHTFLNHFFSNPVFENIGFISPSLEELQEVNWTSTASQKGEIDLLCDILDDAKKNVSFISSSNKSIQDIKDTSAVENMLKNGLDSKLFAPSILNIINTSLNDFFKEANIPLSLNELRNEVWKEDCASISELLDLLKRIDLKDLSLQKINPEEFNALLTILHSMEIIQKQDFKAYTDSFGYILYSILAKDEIKDKFGISLQNPSYFQLKNDTEDKWSLRQTNVTIDNASFDITSEGEIKNLCDLIALLKEQETQDKTIEEIFNEPFTDSFRDGLKNTLDSSLLRNLIGSSLSSLIKKAEVPSSMVDFISSIDFDSFGSLNAAEAKQEFDFLVSFYNFSKETIHGENKFSYLTSHLFELDDIENDAGISLLDEFIQLLKQMKDSLILNKKEKNSSLTPIHHFFECIVKVSSMEENVTMAKDRSLQYSVLREMIYSIKDTYKELDLFCEMLKEMQGIGSDFSFGKISKEKAESLLSTMNQSTLFYRYPISLMKKMFKEKNFDSYLKSPSTKQITNPFDFDCHLSTSDEDKSYWKNDYDYLLKIIYEDGILDYFSSDKSFESMDISKITDMDFVFFYHLSKMNLFSERRASVFLFNLMQQATDYDLKEIFAAPSDEFNVYREDKIICRIEELLFSNPKLVNADLVKEEENFKLDLSLLKKTFSALAKEFSLLKNEEINLKFEELLSLPYSVKDDDTIYQSSFTSEILCGALKEAFKNDKLVAIINAADDETKEKFLSFDFYKDDHFYINPIEGRALDGIYYISKKKDSSSPVFSYEELSKIFTLLGTKDSNEVKNCKKQIFESVLNSKEYTENGNGKLGLLLTSSLRNLPVYKKGESIPTKLSDIDDNMFVSISTTSYSEIMKKYEEQIQ